MTDNEDGPDCFDLIDWLVVAHPELYAAIRYLSPSTSHLMAAMQWEKDGRPEIRE